MLRAAAFAVAILGCSLLNATRLPIRTYTTADGLARDHVLCILQDSRGFIWFCTAEGLSRFDGYQFTTYRTEQGLASNVINDFLETRDHRYWVATSDALCRFDPAASGPRFQCLPAQGTSGVPPPEALYQDHNGNVWCASIDAVLVATPADSHFHRVDLGAPPDTQFTALAVDRRGVLWAGSSRGLFRRDPAGAVQHFTERSGLPNGYIMALLEDRGGQLWVGTRAGLARYCSPPEKSNVPPDRVYSKYDGLPAVRIESLFESPNGAVWVGTNLGLAQYTHEYEKGREFQSYTLSQGLSAKAVGAISEDRDGNLWIGTFGSGAMKVARGGFITYVEADGVPQLGALVESPQGELWGTTREENGMRLVGFDGRGFFAVQPSWPPGMNYFGWGRGQVALRDGKGRWWIATGQGLCRFATTRGVKGLEHRAPEAIYTTRDGLPGNDIFRIFEDSRGDIWIGTIGPNAEDGLARWSRSTGRITAYTVSVGLPHDPVPVAFAEDRSGDVWIGLFHGGIARYRRASNTFAVYSYARIPGTVRSLFVDAAGRLWIAASRGLIRIDDPSRDDPHWTVYGTAAGLASSYIASVVEDSSGRIYAATGRGVDSFVPQANGLGPVKHYTSADGIVPGELEIAVRDHGGALWFSTPLGVSRLIPTPAPPRPPPAVLLTGVTAGTESSAVSDLGAAALSGLRLGAAPLRIDFVGLDYTAGEALRYEYKLEGAGSDWSPSTDHRSVVFANLAPGSYRFVVRAVNSQGDTSLAPASVRFDILPPFWRTWWFVCLVAAATLATAIAAHRRRVASLLAVANLRTRIATDLHDDIGASLTQIAILSEVAQRMDGLGTQAAAPLRQISEISRELVDSMSDIVWAINPDNDQLSNLAYRMRRFAGDVLTSRGIELRFRSEIGGDALRIGVDTRRQLYLVFKEAIHNAVRHSGASLVSVDFSHDDHHVALTVTDNGKGFAAGLTYDGRGLPNLRKRAAVLKGDLRITSSAGGGTSIEMHAPLPSPGNWQR